MSGKWNKNYLKIGVVITISGCLCILFYEIIKSWHGIARGLGTLFSALTPFIIGIVIAFLLNPIMSWIRRGITFIFSNYFWKSEKEKVYESAKLPSLILTIVLFLGLLTGFLWLVIPNVAESVKQLVADMPTYVENAQRWIQKAFAKSEYLEGKLSNILNIAEERLFTVLEKNILPNLDNIVIQVTSGVWVGVKAVFNFFVGLIVAIYLLNSKEVFLAQAKKVIYCIFSKKTGNKIMSGFAYANQVFGGFINGKILDSVIIGIICFVFTSVIDMKYAVLISVIVGVTNVIPFFGPFIGAVPGALLALMDDPLMFVIFIVFVLLLQQFDGNILGPLILGDSTGLSGVWVLVAILLGGDLFGVMGMILGVPVFACLYAFTAVLLRDGLRAKRLSSNTEDYYTLKGFDEKTGEPVYYDKMETRRTLKQHKRYMDRLHRKKKENNTEDEK